MPESKKLLHVIKKNQCKYHKNLSITIISALKYLKRRPLKPKYTVCVNLKMNLMAKAIYVKLFKAFELFYSHDDVLWDLLG